MHVASNMFNHSLVISFSRGCYFDISFLSVSAVKKCTATSFALKNLEGKMPVLLTFLVFQSPSEPHDHTTLRNTAKL
jgi:hypothetical protein